jgi:hypothetical protein
MLLSLLVIVDLHKHNKLVTEQRSTQSAINLTIETDWSERGSSKQPVVLYSWRAPDPAYALRYLAPYEDVLRRIEQRYPTSGHFDHWTGRIHLPSGTNGWDYLVVRPANLGMFPVPVGDRIGTVGEYLIMASPQAISPDDQVPFNTVRRP